MLTEHLCDELKAKFQNLGTEVPEEFQLRIYRSISWIATATKQSDNLDIRFLCLWIAFNAAYAKRFNSSDVFPKESNLVENYFYHLNKLDQYDRIYNAIWDKFSDPVRNLMKNKYIYLPFWKHQFGELTEDKWQDKFERDNKFFNTVFSQRETAKVLSSLFRRLYVLRNQLIHGGATYESSKNRPQLRDGTAILEVLVPIFVDIMLVNPEKNWGKPTFPVIED